jgi:hypothetical protein
MSAMTSNVMTSDVIFRPFTDRIFPAFLLTHSGIASTRIGKADVFSSYSQWQHRIDATGKPKLSHRPRA